MLIPDSQPNSQPDVISASPVSRIRNVAQSHSVPSDIPGSCSGPPLATDCSDA